MDLIIPDWNAPPPNVVALSTTRCGGFSPVPYDDGAGNGGLNLGMHVNDAPELVQRNRALLRTKLPAEPAWLSQIHGVKVLDAANDVGAIFSALDDKFEAGFDLGRIIAVAKD